MMTDLTPAAGPAVLSSGKSILIAGLHWQWVTARGRRRMRIEARDQFASHWVALPAGTADEPATWLGLLSQDFPDLPSGKRMASLAAALSKNVPADCWGVFLLPGGVWWFMAMTGGHPSPYGDITGDAAVVTRAAELFRSQVEAPSAGWVVFDPDALFNLPGSRTDTLAELLPVSLPAQSRLQKTDSRAMRHLLVGGLVVGAVVWGVNHWLEAKKQAEHDAWVQEELVRARENSAAKSANLTRPWGGQPDFPGMLTVCIQQWRSAQLSIAGWVFSRVICDSNGQLTLHYALPSGGTVGDFATRLPQLYGSDVKATFNMPGPSDDASFTQTVKFTPTSAEKLLPGDEQLRRMTSYAQRLRANLRFSEPEVLTKLVGQEKVPLPWKRYSFTFITDIPPDRLFDASRFPGNGLRLSTVKAELHGSRLTYTLEGMLYADN